MALQTHAPPHSPSFPPPPVLHLAARMYVYISAVEATDCKEGWGSGMCPVVIAERSHRSS